MRYHYFTCPVTARPSVYVVSKSGLQVVEKHGNVTNIYSNSDLTVAR